MGYPPSAFKTWTSGEILTASDLNNTVTQINTTNQTEDIDDYSATNGEMQSTVDPYPAGSESKATALSGEIERLRYLIAQLSGETQWYIDPDTTIAALNTADAANVKLTGDQSISGTKTFTGAITSTGVITATGGIASLFAYRRPTLEWVSVTAVNVENNTGTAHQTTIVFPDGTIRSVTEDVSSTHKYRQFIITADAEFTSGTEDSGLRAALSEANNTWYAIYAVKSAINSANFVLVGDTTLPLQANFSTLNSAYGTNGWVYLGLIRNGDNSTDPGDIIAFKQSGDETLFTKASDGSAATAAGIIFGDNATSSDLAYSYNAGTGATEIPNNIKLILVFGATAGSSHSLEIGGTLGIAVAGERGTTGTVFYTRTWFPATSIGVDSDGSSTAHTIALSGFKDTVLGGGINPLL